jgi:membrane protein DedA with SNARE-associated domain
VSDLLDSLLHLPAAAVYGVIAALAAAENVFPPVPADSAVALGAFLSAGGRVSALAVFGITWSANLAGATVVYGLARTAGRAFFQGPIGRRLLNPAALTRLERLHHKYGIWGIFLSRFVPGVRAVGPPFAGIANVGVVRALVPMAVASGLWYGALTLAAATLVRNLDQIAAFTSGLSRVALVLVILALVAGGTALIVSRRRRHPRTDSPGS